MEPPGWTMAVTPASAANSMLSGNGEEGVGGQHAPLGFLRRRPLGQVHAYYPVGLARPHSHQCPVLGEDDGVGLDVLDCLPGEGQVLKLIIGRPPIGHRFPRRRVLFDRIRCLHQHSAGNRGGCRRQGFRGLSPLPSSPRGYANPAFCSRWPGPPAHSRVPPPPRKTRDPCPGRRRRSPFGCSPQCRRRPKWNPLRMLVDTP